MTSPYDRCTWIVLNAGMPPTDQSGVPWWEYHRMPVVMMSPVLYERLKWADDLSEAEELVAELVKQAAGVLCLPEEES